MITVKAHARTSTVSTGYTGAPMWVAWCVCGYRTRAATATLANAMMRRHCQEANRATPRVH